MLFDGGSSINIFTIILTSPETTPITLIIDAGEASQGSQLISNLEPNTEYSVQTSLGNSIDTTLVNYSVTTARGPPTKPNQPTVSEIQLHSVQLAFQIPSIGSDPVDYYLVNISEGDAIRQLIIESDHSHVLSVSNDDSGQGGEATNGQSVVLMVASLDSRSTYSFSVSAGGVAGSGPFSEYSESITTGKSAIIITG